MRKFLSVFVTLVAVVFFSSSSATADEENWSVSERFNTAPKIRFDYDNSGENYSCSVVIDTEEEKWRGTAFFVISFNPVEQTATVAQMVTVDEYIPAAFAAVAGKKTTRNTGVLRKYCLEHFRSLKLEKFREVVSEEDVFAFLRARKALEFYLEKY